MTNIFGRFRSARVNPDVSDDDDVEKYNTRLQVIINTKDERNRVFLHDEESHSLPQSQSQTQSQSQSQTQFQSSEQRRTQWLMNTSDIRELQHFVTRNTHTPNTRHMESRLNPIYFPVQTPNHVSEVSNTLRLVAFGMFNMVCDAAPFVMFMFIF